MLKKAGLQATLGARQGAQAHTRLLHLPRELIPASCFSTFPPHLQADPSASVGLVSARLSPKQGARGQGPRRVRAKGSLSLLGPHQETTRDQKQLWPQGKNPPNLHSQAAGQAVQPPSPSSLHPDVCRDLPPPLASTRGAEGHPLPDPSRWPSPKGSNPARVLHEGITGSRSRCHRPVTSLPPEAGDMASTSLCLSCPHGNSRGQKGRHRPHLHSTPFPSLGPSLGHSLGWVLAPQREGAWLSPAGDPGLGTGSTLGLMDWWPCHGGQCRAP